MAILVFFFFFFPPVHSFLDISLLSSHHCNTYPDGRMVGRNFKKLAPDCDGWDENEGLAPRNITCGVCLVLLILYLPVTFLTMISFLFSNLWISP